MELLEVTQEDIDNGVRGSETHCPLALFLNRVLAEKHRPARVEKNGVRTANNPDKWHPLGKEIVEWIDRFDRGEPVEPLALNTGRGGQFPTSAKAQHPLAGR